MVIPADAGAAFEIIWLHGMLAHQTSEHDGGKFKSDASDIHDGKYDYSKVDYQHSSKHVTITCPRHGDFEQRAQYSSKWCWMFQMLQAHVCNVIAMAHLHGS